MRKDLGYHLATLHAFSIVVRILLGEEWQKFKQFYFRRVEATPLGKYLVSTS